MRIIAAELTAYYILHSVCLMLDRIKNDCLTVSKNVDFIQLESNLVNLSCRTCVGDIIN